MLKIDVLKELIGDRLLKDKVYNELGITQETIGQSFRRCLKQGKPSGKSHDSEVLRIIEKHLKRTKNELYDAE